MRTILRAVLLTIIVAIASSCHTTRQAEGRKTVDNALQNSVDSLLRGKPAMVGVAVSYGGRMLCEVNGDREFPMMSVFKLHQAIAVLDSIGKAKGSLTDSIDITAAMLRPHTYSPLRDRYPHGGIRMSIEELLRYTLWLSDNNACDILFDRFGGTSYANALMERLGLRHTQIRWTEDEMHQAPTRCADNFTTPCEALLILEKSFADEWLKSTLYDCQTGKNRLPALLPPGTMVGHKTGTGDPTADGLQCGINDIGFVKLPNGSHFYIAVFCDHARMTMPETESLIAQIARLAYEHITASQTARPVSKQ